MSQNGTKTRAPKAASDYVAMLDDAALKLEGLEARRNRAEAELNRLLGNHENAEKIRQLILRPGDGFAVTVGKAAILDAQAKRYRRLIDAQNATSAPAESD